MKTTLSAHVKIAIPQQVQAADGLVPGDSFELERTSCTRILPPGETNR